MYTQVRPSGESLIKCVVLLCVEAAQLWVNALNVNILLSRLLIKSRRMRWAGHVARKEEGRGVHKVLVRKPEGKRPVGRPRRRWEDNIKIDLEDVGRGCGTGWSWLRIGNVGGRL